QIEGNILQTVSRTLKEQVTFDRSRVTSVDWESYPILTFLEIPEVHIELIDRPGEKPWGAGEPAASVVSAANSNAVYNAVGARLLREEVDRVPDYYAEHGGSFWIVEDAAGVVAGMFGLESAGPGAAEIRRMYVNSRARRSGIARAMLCHAEELCRAAGLDRIV